MSPRRRSADTYTCDQCGTSQQEPIHNGWFEVRRPTAINFRRIDDWWAPEDRYFCSATCLHARLAQQLQHPPSGPEEV